MTPDTDLELSTRFQRLKFRAWRRGFREADLILGPFVDQYGPEFSEAEFDEIEHLLSAQDQDLYGWILGREAPPKAFDVVMLARLQAFRDALASSVDPAVLGG